MSEPNDAQTGSLDEEATQWVQKEAKRRFYAEPKRHLAGIVSGVPPIDAYKAGVLVERQRWKDWLAGVLK